MVRWCVRVSVASFVHAKRRNIARPQNAKVRAPAAGPSRESARGPRHWTRCADDLGARRGPRCPPLSRPCCSLPLAASAGSPPARASSPPRGAHRLSCRLTPHLGLSAEALPLASWASTSPTNEMMCFSPAVSSATPRMPCVVHRPLSRCESGRVPYALRAASCSVQTQEATPPRRTHGWGRISLFSEAVNPQRSRPQK